MNDEKKLKKILGDLKRFVNRRDGHVLAAITYPPTEEEAKGFYIAGNWVHYLTVGDASVVLLLIRHKFYKSFKEAEEMDKVILGEIKRRKKAKKPTQARATHTILHTESK